MLSTASEAGALPSEGNVSSATIADCSAAGVVKLAAVLWTIAAVDASVGKANWMVTALTAEPAVETLRGDAPPVDPVEMLPAVIMTVEPGGAPFVKPIARAAA